jgi:hypothetical protein
MDMFLEYMPGFGCMHLQDDILAASITLMLFAYRLPLLLSICFHVKGLMHSIPCVAGSDIRLGLICLVSKSEPDLKLL